ncbi:MAG: hypothetical protein HY722_04425 [Planctomycetes bacterium]|nr:hypothetical protein [Planctomycetota bacterium]
MRTLHGRRAGVEATRTLLAAPLTDEAMRLAAVAGLASMASPEAIEALREHLGRIETVAAARRTLQVIADRGGADVLRAVLPSLPGDGSLDDFALQLLADADEDAQ